MKDTDLKHALLSKCPVVFNDQIHGVLQFQKVSAIIYRVGEFGNIKVSAECIDKSGMSLIIVDPKYLNFCNSIEVNEDK
jgi:hypothetical protein